MAATRAMQREALAPLGVNPWHRRNASVTSS